MKGASNSLERIRQTLQEYALSDIYNADECGLSYRMPRDQTVATRELLGRKKAKERFTFLVCSNADGTDKYELMIIGTAWKPRPFKKRSGHEPGFDYHNKKSLNDQQFIF